MAEQSETQAMLVRAKVVAQQIRQREAYPALIGGIAGGMAGALMAVLIAGRITTQRGEDMPRAKESRKFDRSWRELMQLATIVASLAKQVRAWSKGRAKS